MSDLYSIRSELRGVENGDSPGESRPPRKRKHGQKYETRPKTPLAPAAPSEAAQRWMDHGQQRNFDFPFDANWLAHRIQERFEADPFHQRLVELGRVEDAWRLVNKQVDMWWKHYADEEINRKNAASYFLTTDWEDCRYFSHSTLRAIYLRENGRPVEPVEQEPEAVQAHRHRLEDIEETKRFREWVDTVDMDAEPPRVDENRRDRLRSFVEGHRQKRSKK